MNFSTSDLLSFDSLEKLLTSDDPNDRADIITDKLKYYCFFNKGEFYKFDSSKVIYKKVESTLDDELLTCATKYIGQSIKSLTNELKELLKLKYPKESKKISENTTMGKSLSQIRVGLKRDDEDIFTPNFYEIHFQNGFIDLKTLKFHKREIGKHYINCYIKRDYIKSTEKQQNEMQSIIKKIYPKREDYEAMLFILGSAMTGKATKLQKILFLLGTGSAGKSTIMQITQKAVECYLETLEEDAFSESNKNADKTFSNFYNKSSVRIIWTNEPKEDKMNKAAFKKFCEGEMKGKLLWKNGTHDFKHYGLPVFTANIMPNINIDSGVKRRFRCYNHTSEFTSDKSKINEAKSIFYKDLDLLENIVKNSLLDAWIDIISIYANKWINGEEIPIPESFKAATEEIIDANDHIQDFIDAKLIKTDGGKKDRIGKNEMIKLYKEMYPNRGINHQILKPSLCERGIVWDKEIRGEDGVKGCYYNIRAREIDEVMEDDNNDNDYQFGKVQNNNNDLLNQIEELKKQLEEANNKLEQYKIIKTPIILTDDDDFITDEDLEAELEKKIKEPILKATQNDFNDFLKCVKK
jgi:phage/plasmid-associated DNA primase